MISFAIDFKTYKRAISALKESSYALLFPSFCLSCSLNLEKDSTFLCNQCVEQLCLLEPLNQDLGGRKKGSGFCPEAACFDYFGAIEAVVSTFRSARMLHLAEPLAAYLLIQHDRLNWPNPDIVTCVPESRLLSKLKGAHPNELLACSLSKMIGSTFIPLTKKRYYGVGKAHIVQHPTAHLAKGKTVLLIDTLFGQETENTKKILQEINPHAIYILTLCKKEE